MVESLHLSWSVYYLSTFLGYLHIFTLQVIFFHRDLTNEPSVCVSFHGNSDLYLWILVSMFRDWGHEQRFSVKVFMDFQTLKKPISTLHTKALGAVSVYLCVQVGNTKYLITDSVWEEPVGIWQIINSNQIQNRDGIYSVSFPSHSHLCPLSAKWKWWWYNLSKSF